MSVPETLQELLDAVAAMHTEAWHVEHGYNRYVIDGLYAPECDNCLKAEAAEETLAAIPPKALAHVLLNLHALLKREHGGPMFDLHVKGIEEGTLPPCDACVALKLPDLAEAMEGKG